jgi:4-amino-4-deoxy-L-arabinose transferase-like glycosyltransferase
VRPHLSTGWRAALSGPRASRSARILGVLAVAALSLLAGLGQPDLISPDEGRYAQVAEETRAFEHGASGLALLHLNGEFYDQKPPLWFWLAALAGAPTGRVSELAARLPSALAGLGTVLLALRLGTSLLGASTGLVAAAILTTTPQFVVLARRASLDALLTFFTTLALACFWRFERGAQGGRGALLGMHAALGLAVLTKGPVGFLVPVLAIAAYLGWERRLGDLRRLFAPGALPFSLGPPLAWFAVTMALAPEGYLATGVGENLFGRFFVGKHDQPLYFYLEKFPQQFLPWTLAWPLVWWIGRRRVFAAGAEPGASRAWRFLLAWVAATLVFFSLSSGKRGLYLLPAYPGAALLCADALVRSLRDRVALPSRTSGVLGIGLALVAAAATAGVVLDLHRLPPASRSLAWATLASTLVAGSALWLHRRRRIPLAPALGVPWLCLAGVQLAGFLLLGPPLAAKDSVRRLAEQAAELAPPGEPIALYRSQSLLGGLVYYSRHTIVPLASRDDLGGLLERGDPLVIVDGAKRAPLEEVARLDVQAEVELGDDRFLIARARRLSRSPRSKPGRPRRSPGSRASPARPCARDGASRWRCRAARRRPPR